MIRKVITAMMFLCFLFGMSVMAEDIGEGSNMQFPLQQEQIPAPPQDGMEGDRMPPEEMTSPKNNIENEHQKNSQMPGGMGEFGMENAVQNKQTQVPTGFWGFVQNYSTPVISVVLLGIAFVFVIVYKRKRY